MTSSQFDYIFKVVIVGDAGVGKSALLIRYCDDVYDPNYMATIGVDFRVRTVEVDEKIVKMQIWDTAGHERFRALTQSYYRGVHAVLLCFDVTNVDSFRHCENWLKDIQKYSQVDCSIILVATKTDLVEKRLVSQSEGELFAKQHDLLYIETSSKQNVQVENSFSSVVSRRIEQCTLQKIEANKSGDPLSLHRSVPVGNRKRRSCFGLFYF
jgi:Ras-related protein Rab-1A